MLCLKVARELRVWQPSLGVRIGPETSAAFWDAALELCAAGFGMPSFFNDPVVIKALEAVGIPAARARDWSIVGCYEAAPQGDCCSQTVAGQWVLPSVLIAYLDSLPSGNGPANFATFSDGLKSFMAADFATCLKRYQQQWNSMAANQSSPFESLCLTGCTESGLTAEEGGARFSLFGVNILGLGTLVDSLHVIDRLVYGTGHVTLDALRRQLKENFADTAFQAQCRNLPGKYGTDTPATNDLAAEFANHIADLVLASRMEHGVRPYPGLFIFTGWVHHQVPATPDGRRAGDMLSYGIGPSAFAVGQTPTSVLASAAVTANDRCACGNPLLISFNRNEIRGNMDRTRLRQTLETYFRLGGFHLHFNLVDADRLREAQAHPQAHADLLVRISGFSAQFVTLDERLQNGLIERTEQGL
jgi:formate C-acetyltransferase